MPSTPRSPTTSAAMYVDARVPIVVAPVNYGLAPEFKHPNQYDDGFDVLKFIDARY